LANVKRISPLLRPFWRKFGKFIGRDLLDRGYKLIKVSDKFNLPIVLEMDYFVIAGNALTVLFSRVAHKLLCKLKERGVKIIFYGCGGTTYSDFEINIVKRMLKEIKPYALITRDSIAFQEYGNLAEYSFDGIDAAFFVNKLQFKLFKLNLPPYVVLVFDKPQSRRIEKALEKELKERYLIIKACHTPIPYFFSDPVADKSKFVSNSPYDYLSLYAHAEEVHGDRVHACIVALAFGKRCRLYGKTVRVALFEKICTGDLTSETVLPKGNIDKLQEKQISFLSHILE